MAATSTLSAVGSGAATGFLVGGPWGAAIGGGVGLLGSLLNNQKAPKAVTQAPFERVDITAEQRRALAANQVAEGDIEGLLSRANSFNQGQATSLMEQAVPGWSKLSQKFLQTADSLVTNPYDVPKDVEQNLARIAAERGISSGARGQFSEFSLLRDLGVNALKYGESRINQGAGLLQLIGSLSPKVSPLSPLSFYINPGQAADVAARNSAGVAGVAGANQGVAQGAENAGVAAMNWNRNNAWDSFAQFAAVIPSLIPRGSGSGLGGGSYIGAIPEYGRSSSLGNGYIPAEVEQSPTYPSWNGGWDNLSNPAGSSATQSTFNPNSIYRYTVNAPNRVPRTTDDASSGFGYIVPH